MVERGVEKRLLAETHKQGKGNHGGQMYLQRTTSPSSKYNQLLPCTFPLPPIRTPWLLRQRLFSRPTMLLSVLLATVPLLLL